VIVPSGSVLPAALNATDKGAVPLVGFAPITAVGGVLPDATRRPVEPVMELCLAEIVVD
jgi:hypothetical protein